jgi:hypothetical protein
LELGPGGDDGDLEHDGGVGGEVGHIAEGGHVDI